MRGIRAVCWPVLVLLLCVSLFQPLPASAFNFGKFLDETNATLDRVNAKLDQVFGGTTPTNETAIERSQDQTPTANAFIGKWEESWETKMGQQTHESLKKDPGFVRDQAMLARVARVAIPLVKVVERKNLNYHFAVLDSDELNAFAAPGGYIYVTKGLMKAIGSDDELAGVLAHELAHVQYKHSVRQAEKKGLLVALVAALGLNKKTQKYTGAAALAAYFANQKFSRDDEFQADAGAVKYAHAAGFDPRGLVTFFNRINRDNSLSKVTKIFSTHPPTNERIQKVEAQIAKLPPRSAGTASGPTASSPSSNAGSTNQAPQTSTSTSTSAPTQSAPAPVSGPKPTADQVRAAYETYLFYKAQYEQKVAQQAPVNEIMDALKRYQDARDNYLRLRQAAGL
jgi:beta-barrel assembly-enhancing protease